MISIVRHHTQELVDRGYTLLEGIHSDEEATAALSHFGQLMPQYDGQLRYQVKAVPGYEHRRYSKSTNTIKVHTEAPGWQPPPRYLALHCRVQATCGSGHTDLADARAFLASLDDDMQRTMRERQVDWLGHNTAGSGGTGVRRPSVERTGDGREIIRFSYNLLTAGHYDPLLEASPSPESLPLGRRGLDLAEQAVAFFREHRVSILIPEDAVLLWDNQRTVHARSEYTDTRRHLTRYWLRGHG